MSFSTSPLVTRTSGVGSAEFVDALSLLDHSLSPRRHTQYVQLHARNDYQTAPEARN